MTPRAEAKPDIGDVDLYRKLFTSVVEISAGHTGEL